MTDPSPVHFGELIAHRLCHDLVNPLGAVGNGLELMALTQAETPEMDLVKDSLAQALGRIKLYRLAFGAAPAGSNVARAEIAGALGALGGSRALAVQADLPATLPRCDARLVTLLALCAEAALAWGGRLGVRAADGAIALTAEAPRLRTDAEPWAALSQGRPPNPATPSLVQFALVPEAARACGRRVGVAIAEGRIDLTA